MKGSSRPRKKAVPFNQERDGLFCKKDGPHMYTCLRCNHRAQLSDMRRHYETCRRFYKVITGAGDNSNERQEVPSRSMQTSLTHFWRQQRAGVPRLPGLSKQAVRGDGFQGFADSGCDKRLLFTIGSYQVPNPEYEPQPGKEHSKEPHVSDFECESPPHEGGHEETIDCHAAQYVFVDHPFGEQSEEACELFSQCLTEDGEGVDSSHHMLEGVSLADSQKQQQERFAQELQRLYQERQVCAQMEKDAETLALADLGGVENVFLMLVGEGPTDSQGQEQERLAQEQERLAQEQERLAEMEAAAKAKRLAQEQERLAREEDIITRFHQDDERFFLEYSKQRDRRIVKFLRSERTKIHEFERDQQERLAAAQEQIARNLKDEVVDVVLRGGDGVHLTDYGKDVNFHWGDRQVLRLRGI